MKKSESAGPPETLTVGRVLALALSFATGISFAEASTILSESTRIRPGLAARFSKSLSEDEASVLLSKLKYEAPGIRRWIAEGYHDAITNGWPPIRKKRIRSKATTRAGLP